MKLFILSALLAFVFSLGLCRLCIPLLRRLKAGQNILSYVKEHHTKSGTPTMGGIAFLLAVLLVSILWIKEANRSILLTYAIGLSYMLIGLMDDLLKLRHKQNLGLTAKQKFFFQICVAVFAGIYCFRAGLTSIFIPFTKWQWDIGMWIIPLSIFAFLGMVNATNLTDGLDGLASGVSVPFFACMGVVILLQEGNTHFSLLCFCMVGALLAYLLFNISPASVFMGDTGSLALGGFMASIGIFSGNVLYLAVLGAMFMLSVITVIIQVIYYKATGGKRVFLMSPIHHHFQQKGYSESKIAYAYSLITWVIGGVCILTIL